PTDFISAIRASNPNTGLFSHTPDDTDDPDDLSADSTDDNDDFLAALDSSADDSDDFMAALGSPDDTNDLFADSTDDDTDDFMASLGSSDDTNDLFTDSTDDDTDDFMASLGSSDDTNDLFTDSTDDTDDFMAALGSSDDTLPDWLDDDGTNDDDLLASLDTPDDALDLDAALDAATSDEDLFANNDDDDDDDDPTDFIPPRKSTQNDTTNADTPALPNWLDDDDETDAAPTLPDWLDDDDETDVPTLPNWLDNNDDTTNDSADVITDTSTSPADPPPTLPDWLDDDDTTTNDLLTSLPAPDDTLDLDAALDAAISDDLFTDSTDNDTDDFMAALGASDDSDDLFANSTDDDTDDFMAALGASDDTNDLFADSDDDPNDFISSLADDTPTDDLFSDSIDNLLTDDADDFMTALGSPDSTDADTPSIPDWLDDDDDDDTLNNDLLASLNTPDDANDLFTDSDDDPDDFISSLAGDTPTDDLFSDSIDNLLTDDADDFMATLGASDPTDDDDFLTTLNVATDNDLFTDDSDDFMAALGASDDTNDLFADSTDDDADDFMAALGASNDDSDDFLATLDTPTIDDPFTTTADTDDSDDFLANLANDLQNNHDDISETLETASDFIDEASNFLTELDENEDDWVFDASSDDFVTPTANKFNLPTTGMLTMPEEDASASDDDFDPLNMGGSADDDFDPLNMGGSTNDGFDDDPIAVNDPDADLPDWLLGGDDGPTEGALGDDLPDWLGHDPLHAQKQAESAPSLFGGGAEEDYEESSDYDDDDEDADWPSAQDWPSVDWPTTDGGAGDDDMPTEVPDWLLNLDALAEEEDDDDGHGLPTPSPNNGDLVAPTNLPDWIADKGQTVNKRDDDKDDFATFEEDIHLDRADIEADELTDVLDNPDVPSWLKGVFGGGDDDAASGLSLTGENAPDDSWDELSTEDWLSDAGTSVGGGIDLPSAAEWERLSQEDGAAQLSEAHIPEWLRALKPSANTSNTAMRSFQDGPKATSGPLTGLSGIIPVAAIITEPRTATEPRTLTMSANQAEQVELLQSTQQILPLQTIPLPDIDQEPLPQQWRFAIILTMFGLLITMLLLPNLLNITPQPTDDLQTIETQLRNARNQPVLVAFDYPPAMAGALDPQAEIIIQLLNQNNNDILAMSQLPSGVGLYQSLLADQDNVTSLGYIPGDAVGLRRLADCLGTNELCRTLYGRDLDNQLSETALIIILTSERDNLLHWMEQVTIHTDIPVIGAVPQALAPITGPYVASQQLDATITGLATTASLAAKNNFENTAAPTLYQPQVIGQWFIAFLLIIGNSYAFIKWRQQNKVIPPLDAYVVVDEPKSAQKEEVKTDTADDGWDDWDDDDDDWGDTDDDWK
ncbi:MAG TPA: hypothetical protein VLL52_01985, partial [Anaerolineae bacterium]|nr:hypothetical protein [Anaerolineae bacterium]